MPLPASLDLITVTGQFLKNDGTPQSGTVTFTTTQLLQSGTENLFVTPGSYQASLDGTGAFTVDLPATNDPDWVPQGYTYQLDVALQGFSRMYTLAIPWTAPGGTIDLADVLPNVDVNAPASYVILTSVGQVGGPAGPLDQNGFVPVDQIPTLTDLIPASLLDAKGDLVVATANNTPSRLPVGTTDGHVLKVNSLAPTGLEWGAEAGGGTGGGIDPLILDQKGDLIVATAADTPARFAIGLDGQFLRVDSATTEGMIWENLTEADLSLAVLLDPSTIQIMNPDGTITWLQVTMPYSAGDNNEDLFVIRALHSNGTTAIKTFWWNGNGEPRCAASTANRVAQRIFEIAEAIASAGSTGNVWEVSTNPTDAGAREAYWAVRGNNHATQPGWLVGARPFQATNGKFTGTLNVDGNTTLGGTLTMTNGLTWSNLTLSTNVTAKTDVSEPTPASTIDPFGLVSLRGTIQWSTTFASDASLAQIANAAHRPSGRRTFSVRTGPASNVSTELNIDNDGTMALIVSSGASGRLGLDGIHFRI